MAKATEGDLQAANFVTLTFTTQKNGIRDEKIGHNASGDPLLCPKVALLRRVLCLRAHGVPPFTLLSRIMTLMGRWKILTPTMILKTLKTAVGFCGTNLVLKDKDMLS